MDDTFIAEQTLSQRGTWRTYTTADGLAGLLVEHIAQDRDGFLWFATTTGGASCFDGDEFRTFTTRDGLCGNQVYALHLDQQGRLWFGTLDGGICWYDGCSFHSLEVENEFSGRSITYLFEDREGWIWFGGPDVLGYWDDAEAHELISAYHRRYKKDPGTCWGIAQDEEGRIWFGLRGNLTCYDGSEFQSLDNLPSLQYGVYSVAQNSEGGLWIGHRENIWRYRSGVCRPVPIKFKGYLRKIQHDREGRTWFCLSGGGVLYYDGTEFYPFTSQDGLACDDVNALFQDPEGQYWFATWGGGISCYDPHSIHTFGEKTLPRKQVCALREDRWGIVWMGFSDLLPPSSISPKGIWYYDGERFADLKMEEGLDALVIHEDRKGNLWLGGFQGLRRYDGQSIYKIGLKEGFDGSWVSAIAEDEEGYLFFGHRDSAESEVQISRYDGRHFETLYREESKDAFYSINAISITRNRDLYFALGDWKGQGRGRGIGRCDAGGNIAFYTTADGLIDNRIEALLEDHQGDLWIGTWGGISRFDGVRFQNFTIENGLPNNHIQCICEDRQGHLWFGTEGGVVHWDGRIFQSICSPDILYVNKIVEDRMGRFWFATLNGAVHYTPSRTPPRVRLLQLIADQVYPGGERTSLSTSVRQAIFEYKGLSFRTHPRDMLYLSRLQGYDEDWQPATRSLRAFYRDLPPGEYTFQVCAVDRDLNYSAPATVELTVEPDPHIEALTEALSGSRCFEEFVGYSPALRNILAQLEQVAATDLTVLILGETGTGKGLAARMLHRLSPRRTGPFIQVSCGVLPRELVENELFGHEKGAFTGATPRKLGKVELAEGGTLFLDEIGDLVPEAQVKLLRLLEERTFERVGGTQTLKADVRVIAATNRDLRQMVAEGRFREDLYYRLQVFVVRLPPLRERQEDIAVLATHFLRRMAAQLHKEVTHLTPEALALLYRYDWPGNVRELEHVVQRAVVVCSGPVIEVEDIALEFGRAEPEGEQELLPEEYERRYLVRVLEECGWVVKGPRGAAARLGMAGSTLYDRIKKLGLRRP